MELLELRDRSITASRSCQSASGRLVGSGWWELGWARAGLGRPADFGTQGVRFSRLVGPAPGGAQHQGRSTVTKTASELGEARTVALSVIEVSEQFNPRDHAEEAAIDRLADSMRQHGPLVPLLVAPNGDERFRLVAGERRFRAAQRAGLKEIPVVVRETDERSGGLALALVENIAREDLNPVEEARGFKRLMDEDGLTRKGVAEVLSIAQKRVTERLQILDVPEELHPRIASGEIPPSAIKALAALARIHPGLPAVAVAHVEHEVREAGWEQPVEWSDVAEDPVYVVAGGYDDERALPAGVYLAGGTYAVESFSLSEKANRDLAKYAQLLDTEPPQLTVRFGRESVEQAHKLGAYHPSANGYTGLIVGQEVADQLAGDCIAAELKALRKHQRTQERWERERREAAGGEQESSEPPSEEEQKRQRREQRQRDAEARKEATAYNHELGAACVKHLSRVRVDERVVKLVACVDVQGELDKIAMRGARYGFPGWTEEVEQKNGRRKVIYRDQGECREAARSFLDGAKTAAEVAGRLVALIAMARYAREDAVAQSNRAHYAIEVRDYYGHGVPWSREVVDIVDAICAERLPDHLTKEVRQARAKARREQARAQRQERKRERIVADALKRVDGLDAKQRDELVAEVEGQLEQLGGSRFDAHELTARVRELNDAEAARSDEQTAEPEREAA
jgi:ParB/RepB/Spo0J family partition protein